MSLCSTTTPLGKSVPKKFIRPSSKNSGMAESNRFKFSSFPQREANVLAHKYYAGEWPLPCKSTDHPLYFQYEMGTEMYCDRVTNWMNHWCEKGKNQDAIIFTLKQIAFMDAKSNLVDAATALKDRIRRDHQDDYDSVYWFSRDSDTPVKVILNTTLPLKLLNEVFLASWNYSNPPAYIKNSANLMIIAYKLLGKFEADSIDSPVPIDLNVDGLISNSEARSIVELRNYWANAHMLFELRQCFAIERTIFFPDGYSPAIETLKKIAFPEEWGKDQWMLKSLVNQTLLRQMQDGNIRECATLLGKQVKLMHNCSIYGCHLHLLDKLGNPIIILLQANSRPELRNPPEYTFSGFYMVNNNDIERFESQLPRPIWCNDVRDLIYDPKFPIIHSQESITSTFSKNLKQIQRCLNNFNEGEIQRWLPAEFHRQVFQAKFNFRLITPHLYKETQIQLLLPLFEKGKVVLVASLAKTDSDYQLDSVLEPFLAYHNARILGRIESNWLTADLIKECDPRVVAII